MVGGTVLVALFTPSSLPLGGLTFAGLQLVGGTRSRTAQAGALLIGLLSAAALVLPQGSAIDGVTGVFQLLTAVAFVTVAWAAPGGGPFLRRATGALAWGAAGATALAWILNGADTWGLLAWDAVRQASFAERTIIEAMTPQALSSLYSMYEPMVRFLSAARPGLEILGGYGALAAVWQWHVRTARAPLGPPLGAFREFRFADGAVWGVIVATIVWIAAAKAPGLRIAALNAELVLGVLYLLRGAAIVGAAAALVAIPVWMQVTAVLSGVLFAAVTAPSLCLLGVSDTWMEFRRRLSGRPT